jgi:hypothetical protein
MIYYVCASRAHHSYIFMKIDLVLTVENSNHIVYPYHNITHFKTEETLLLSFAWHNAYKFYLKSFFPWQKVFHIIQ